MVILRHFYADFHSHQPEETSGAVGLGVRWITDVRTPSPLLLSSDAFRFSAWYYGDDHRRTGVFDLVTSFDTFPSKPS
jgi:hypothetical protein